jgi:hypothetical protein
MTPLSPLVAQLVQRLSESLREDFEERAAIVEFEASLPRVDAECFALIDVVSRHPGALLGAVVLKGTVEGAPRVFVSLDEQRARAHLTSVGATSVDTLEFSYAIDDVLGGLVELVPVPTRG